jgi:hypothetical protein
MNKNALRPDHFNYRLVIDKGEVSEETISLREVYYSKEGKVVGVAEQPTPLLAESWDGVREELMLFIEAQTFPAWHAIERRWVILRPGIEMTQEQIDTLALSL